MMPRLTAKQKALLIGLIGLGFVGLIGAHELATTASSSADDPRAALPLILAGLGTLCFVAAGLLARKLMKQRAPQ